MFTNFYGFMILAVTRLVISPGNCGHFLRIYFQDEVCITVNVGEVVVM